MQTLQKHPETVQHILAEDTKENMQVYIQYIELYNKVAVVVYKKKLHKNWELQNQKL